MKFSQKKIVATAMSPHFDVIDRFIIDQLKCFFPYGVVSQEDYNKLKSYIAANDIEIIKTATEKYLQEIKNKDIHEYLGFLKTYLHNQKNFEEKFAKFIPYFGADVLARRFNANVTGN